MAPSLDISSSNTSTRYQSSIWSTSSLHEPTITVNHQGGPSPSGGGRNWVHFPTKCLSSCSTYLLYVLGHLRHPLGKPFDADPVRLCQTLARKGTAEIRFEAVSGRSEANVPARRGPLQIVAACRLAWRSGQISDSETDLLRAAESPSPSGEG